MNLSRFVLLAVLLSAHCASVLCSSSNFDFFFFVQQWPGAYCDSKQSCCFPTTGKPASDFSIHGLWPNFKDGSYPSNCDPDSPFDESKVTDLISSMRKNWPTLACPSGDGIKFWTHEWEKHGTCSESILDQHSYFQSTLALKTKSNILQSLISTGIKPDDGFYSLADIKDAIKQGTGFEPFIECNNDSSGNSQLYQVYLCVDTTGADLIECPTFPRGRCGSEIQFPIFGSARSMP
ncbi:unnamed protein product [Rhodiola kirilowii]